MCSPVPTCKQYTTFLYPKKSLRNVHVASTCLAIFVLLIRLQKKKVQLHSVSNIYKDIRNAFRSAQFHQCNSVPHVQNVHTHFCTPITNFAFNKIALTIYTCNSADTNSAETYSKARTCLSLMLQQYKASHSFILK